MKITYDPEADALYIQLRDGVAAVDAVDIEDGVLADIDKGGHIIGFEVLDAGKRLSPEELSQVQFKTLPKRRAWLAFPARPTRLCGESSSTLHNLVDLDTWLP